jgi:hypothetical protein
MRFSRVCGALTLALFLPASAYAIPIGWTCTGNCGTSGADGVVTAPAGSYEWVSTSGGVAGVGSLGLGAETNGSLLQTTTFFAAAGDELTFFFNYVTSDGAGFADYAWAGLVDVADPTDLFLLFSARTTPGGDTVPGFGMPDLGAGVVLTPSSTPIIAGAPVWSPLGLYSGQCFSAGCGYTGWIQMTYTIDTPGFYYLLFGTTNWVDQIFDSGMAIYGATIGGTPITPDIPEPSTLALFGLAGLAALRRRLVGRSL